MVQPRRARTRRLGCPGAVRQGIVEDLFSARAEAGTEACETGPDSNRTRPAATALTARVAAVVRPGRTTTGIGTVGSSPAAFQNPIGTLKPMPDILLATLNAKFIHAAFGLRYLLANMGELKPRTELLEFDINQKAIDIAEAVLARRPRILGLGVYIWNVALTTELVGMLKRARPDLVIVLGGPEVSFECDQQEIIRLADHTITGEADLKFAEVCRLLLGEADGKAEPLADGEHRTGTTAVTPPPGLPARLPKIIPAELPDLKRLELPYDLYDERDAAHRVIYVEVSRGCPFTCEFCLSSLDIPVRQFDLDRFLAAMQRLLDRGVRRFKFVDRTFNLHLPTSTAILRFFLERWTPGLFVHFEMVPDRLPVALRELIAKFPPGALQFEVGIQTFDPEVEKLISRRQDHARLDDNFRWLRAESGVHVHADLIAGLPGETMAGFAAGFDRLVALRPQEIQVGILKRLRGTPIVRHDRDWSMVYSPQPPYEILQNKLLDFAALGRLRRFAKFWDIFGNSGDFVETLPLLWTERGRPARDGGLAEDSSESLVAPGAGSAAAGGTPALPSPFWSVLAFSDWLHARGVKTSGIALARRYELLWDHLTTVAGIAPAEAAAALARDFRRGGRTGAPEFLRAQGFGTDHDTAASSGRTTGLPKRQAKHVGAAVETGG